MKILELKFIEKDNYLVAYIELENGKGIQYSLRFELSEEEVVKENCTCVFGSVYKFSKEHTEKETKCRHIKYCRRILKYLGYIK